jgi:hypothetical protein
MKTTLFARGLAATMLTAAGANAAGIVIEPVFAAPQPVYAAPPPAPVYYNNYGYVTPGYDPHHHRRDWYYWHQRQAHERFEHEHGRR